MYSRRIFIGSIVSGITILSGCISRSRPDIILKNNSESKIDVKISFINMDKRGEDVIERSFSVPGGERIKKRLQALKLDNLYKVKVTTDGHSDEYKWEYSNASALQVFLGNGVEINEITY